MDEPRRALISGITGQDGSYLAEFLLDRGYEVHGIKRRSSSFNTARIDHLYQDPHAGDRRLMLHYGDLTDSTGLVRLVQAVRPDEIYNLAAQSHVAVSFEQPEYTANADALGTLRLLEAVRLLGLESCRFYQASTSELYGKIQSSPQTESTPFYPRSPYGVAKLFAHWITINYREAYGLFACNGILFNHESPRRGETFVSRKISRGLCRIARGLEPTLYLGNLDARRDWGHARDYVEMMWLMLQQDEPRDYVIGTGRQHSVREFVAETAHALGFSVGWEGADQHEIGRVAAIDNDELSLELGQRVVAVDPRYLRPSEVDSLLADASRAAHELGWQPRCGFPELIAEMVAEDWHAAGIDQMVQSQSNGAPGNGRR